MDDGDLVDDADSSDGYWLVRVRPAEGLIGYVAEVYNALPLSIEITEPRLPAVEGEWLRMNVYRSHHVYATKAGVREAATRLRQFLEYTHLRG